MYTSYRSCNIYLSRDLYKFWRKNFNRLCEISRSILRRRKRLKNHLFIKINRFINNAVSKLNLAALAVDSVIVKTLSLVVLYHVCIGNTKHIVYFIFLLVDMGLPSVAYFCYNSYICRHC